MTAIANRLTAGLRKEARALFPTYALILVAVVAGSLGHSHTMIATGLLGYAFGSVALGAQSFGHEYSHRTLGLLLSQPADRRRLYFDKLAVLAIMLVTLAAAALLLFRDVLRLAASPHTEPSMLVMAAACGLFIAPFLTLLCRRTLAAVVFTIAIPGLLAVGADVAGGWLYGLQNAGAIDRFKLMVFWRGMIVICALSAVAGWWMFRRLEVVEGHVDVQLPALVRGGQGLAHASPARRYHPLLALVGKELRLQQMAFVVAVIYAVLWLGLAWLDPQTPDSTNLPLVVPLTLLYGGTLALLIGSLASAEERQLGTLEWQTLLPIPAWRQWAVKVSVIFALALLLAVGLPLLLHNPGLARSHPFEHFGPRVILVFALLTAGSLYVSTLCRSGVGALVLSVPTAAATVLFVQMAGSWLLQLLPSPGRQFDLGPHSALVLLLAIAAGLVGLLLWLGFLNHRSADHSLARTMKQVLGIMGYVTAGLAAVILLGLR